MLQANLVAPATGPPGGNDHPVSNGHDGRTVSRAVIDTEMRAVGAVHRVQALPRKAGGHTRHEAQRRTQDGPLQGAAVLVVVGRAARLRIDLDGPRPLGRRAEHAEQCLGSADVSRQKHEEDVTLNRTLNREPRAHREPWYLLKPDIPNHATLDIPRGLPHLSA